MYLQESDLEPHPKWVGCAVLKDTEGHVRALVARSEVLGPPRPSAEGLSELNQKFWTWCWYAFGKIERGELWEALDGIHSIRSLALVPLLDWAVERRHEGYRRLERKTAPEEALRLLATVAPVRAQALYAALRAEVELFSEATSGGPRPLRADPRSDARGGARERDEPALGRARSAVEEPREACGRQASSCPRT
jgi:hypothetical protein